MHHHDAGWALLFFFPYLSSSKTLSGPFALSTIVIQFQVGIFISVLPPHQMRRHRLRFYP